MAHNEWSSLDYNFGTRDLTFNKANIHKIKYNETQPKATDMSRE